MTHPHPDLSPDLDLADADVLAAMGDGLRHRRPVPRAAFRGDLRRLLVADAPELALGRPSRLWAWVGASWTGGLGLLAFAALSVAGAGPLTV